MTFSFASFVWPRVQNPQNSQFKVRNDENKQQEPSLSFSGWDGVDAAILFAFRGLKIIMNPWFAETDTTSKQKPEQNLIFGADNNIGD